MTTSTDSSFSLRRPARAAARFTLSTLLAIGALGCGPLALDGSGRGEGGGEADGSTSASAPGDDRVAVVIEGEPITVAEVDEFMKQGFLEDLMRKPAGEIFEAREQAIRNLVQKHVVDAEAKARGATPEQLFEQITSQATEPTTEEVASWFAQNEARLRGARLEEIAPQIRGFLLEQRRREAWQDFVGPRLDSLAYEMVLEPPRVDLEATRLIRGPADAPVTITAFSDYQCPYCIRSEPVLAEVLERFPEAVRLVHRHFPLASIHPFARPAAEAAMCADDQGAFWPYHDAIFARNGRLQPETFDEIAKELELDSGRFAACIEERRHADFVRRDIQAGEAAGVTGTPAFFVNGIPLKGARDADEISRIVESELKRLESES